MKGQKTLSISITEENMKELEEAENYLDTSRRALYLLSLYLWRDTTLKEKELRVSLNEIEQSERNEVFISNLPSIYLELYKEKPLYFYSFNQYISGLFHLKVKNGIDPERKAPQKVGKKNRIYYIQKDILKEFVNFSKKIDVNQKTLINYAIMENFHLKDNNEYHNEKEDKQRKGIEFSYPSLEKFDEIKEANREMAINKVLYLIPKLL